MLRTVNMNNSKARSSTAAMATQILPMEVWCDALEARLMYNILTTKTARGGDQSSLGRQNLHWVLQGWKRQETLDISP